MRPLTVDPPLPQLTFSVDHARTNGALHAIAQIYSGDPGAYWQILTQKRNVDRKRVEIACRIAALVGPPRSDQIFGMETCQECQRRKVISYHVEPEEAWKTVVPNQWRVLCASYFDVEAEKAGVGYTFTNLEAQSWSERPAPRASRGKRR